MVHKKSRSKRAPIRRQYSVAKKVKDHNKKLKKMKRLHPEQARKLKRDPGIPNLWPYKEELIRKLEKDREVEEKMQERQKEARKLELEKKRKKALALRLAQAAARSGSELGRAEPEEKEEKEWKSLDSELQLPRSYFKEVKNLIQQADVILEVLDARDPMGCRCPEIEKHILSQMTPTGTPSKRLILILNKIDLIPGENLMAWMKYLRREFPTVAFKSALQLKGKIGEYKLKPSLAIHSKQDTSFSGSIGGNALLQLLKNYSRSHNMKTALNVGVIGYPNVGKSSIINSLKRQRAVKVGATPGVTKTLQHVKLDKQIALIDSPGVLFSVGKEDDDLVLRNCLKAEQLTDPVGVAYRIVAKCPQEQLCQVFQIAAYSSPEEFLQFVATKRGKIKKGGVPDVTLAAKSVILDWNSGKIPFHAVPPIVKDIETSEIVSTWNQEFGVDSVMSQSDVEALQDFTADTAQSFTIMDGESHTEETEETEDVEDAEDSETEDHKMNS